MIERDLFTQIGLLIAEMVVESRKICDVDFEEWKYEMLNSVPEKTKDYTLNVIAIVDKYR